MFNFLETDAGALCKFCPWQCKYGAPTGFLLPSSASRVRFENVAPMIFFDEAVVTYNWGGDRSVLSWLWTYGSSMAHQFGLVGASGVLLIYLFSNF
jgi:hypothetical protein